MQGGRRQGRGSCEDSPHGRLSLRCSSGFGASGGNASACSLAPRLGQRGECLHAGPGHRSAARRAGAREVGARWRARWLRPLGGGGWIRLRGLGWSGVPLRGLAGPGLPRRTGADGGGVVEMWRGGRGIDRRFWTRDTCRRPGARRGRSQERRAWRSSISPGLLRRGAWHERVARPWRAEGSRAAALEENGY